MNKEFDFFFVKNGIDLLVYELHKDIFSTFHVTKTNRSLTLMIPKQQWSKWVGVSIDDTSNDLGQNRHL